MSKCEKNPLSPSKNVQPFTNSEIRVNLFLYAQLDEYAAAFSPDHHMGALCSQLLLSALVTGVTLNWFSLINPIKHKWEEPEIWVWTFLCWLHQNFAEKLSVKTSHSVWHLHIHAQVKHLVCKNRNRISKIQTKSNPETNRFPSISFQTRCFQEQTEDH